MKGLPHILRNDIVEKARISLGQSCAINSYDNRLKVLDANNVFAVDYGKFVEMRNYDTVSYVFNDEDEDNSLILAFKMER